MESQEFCNRVIKSEPLLPDANELTNLQASTITGVIHSLDRILVWAKKHNSRLGYFPALYRRVTIRVKEGIEKGEFDDGPRMERLDILFANRYLEALELYAQGKECTESWKRTFLVAKRRMPIVLQHLMLGMNAHINLDLGISAQQTAAGQPIESIQHDFYHINDLLISMIRDVKGDLGKIWPGLRVLDFFVGKGGTYLATMGLKVSRGFAWNTTTNFAESPPEEYEDRVKRTDQTVARIAENILIPGYIISLVILFIRLGEIGSVSRKIEKLQ